MRHQKHLDPYETKIWVERKCKVDNKWGIVFFHARLRVSQRTCLVGSEKFPSDVGGPRLPFSFQKWDSNALQRRFVAWAYEASCPPIVKPLCACPYFPGSLLPFHWSLRCLFQNRASTKILLLQGRGDGGVLCLHCKNCRRNIHWWELDQRDFLFH